ncbi:hypothetical protein FRC15_001812 [Serendipita sp. 397]|nr:hypothetical protein FRC15_001812 [Serendipita sp. 397]
MPVLLVTSDNEQFRVEKAVAQRSVLIKNMLEGILSSSSLLCLFAFLSRSRFVYRHTKRDQWGKHTLRACCLRVLAIAHDLYSFCGIPIVCIYESESDPLPVLSASRRRGV